MNFFDRTIRFVTVRAVLGLFTSIHYFLEGAAPAQDIDARISHLFQHRFTFRIYQKDARAALTNALENVESVFQVANMEARQSQADIAKVSGTVGQFEFARGARGCFIGHAKARVQYATWSGSS